MPRILIGMGDRFVDNQSRVALWTGAGLSVAAHLAVVVIVAGQPMLRPDGSADSGDEPKPRLFEPPPLRIGEDRGDATAIAWLGYDEYRRHIAQPWIQDQAAFTPSASVPGPLPPAPEPTPAQPAPAAPAEPITEPVPVEVAATPPPPPPLPEIDAAQVAGAMQAASDRARDLASSAIAAIGEAGQALIPPRPRPVPATAEAPPADAGLPPEPTIEPTPEPARELAEATDVPTDRPSRDAQERSAEPSRPSAERSPGSGLPGEVQDREAIAASIERAARVEWGRPLAAAGLRIATVRPRHITPLTRQTTRPRDPVVRIHFGADGRVRNAEFLRSSGHRNVDQPILDAVYQWTASGKPLEALDAGNNGATLAVDIRISL